MEKESFEMEGGKSGTEGSKGRCWFSPCPLSLFLFKKYKATWAVVYVLSKIEEEKCEKTGKIGNKNIGGGGRDGV